MHFLYCDESNIDEHAGDFLIYGGVVVSAEEAASLSHDIERIRTAAGISRDFPLKFNPRPEPLEHNEFRKLKQEIVEAAIDHNVGLLSYAILHDIATSPDEARRFGINTVCFHFDCCLERLNSHGLVLIDRFNDEGNVINAHLKEKFSVGLTDLPYSKEYRLQHILGLHYAVVGQSHFTSLIDIVVGSLRYAMNVHTRKQLEQREGALGVLRLLSPLFIRNGRGAISEFGLIFSPKVVKAPVYREMYQSMKELMAEAGIAIEQEITGERNY